MPKNRLVSPRTAEEPSTADTVTKASTISEKYSAGPNLSARPPRRRRQEGDAERADRAGHERADGGGRQRRPARPLRAILLPSSAVTMVALSPGVLSRIEVVEPPYMAP